MGASEADRFWSKVETSGTDECWPWRGTTFAKGDGRFSSAGTSLHAHRVAWQLTHGDCPELLERLCPTRSCCNPRHLRPTTNAKRHAKRRKSPQEKLAQNVRLDPTTGC